MGCTDPPAGFVRPFRWDGIAFIWDGNNRIACDFRDDGLIRARGWGRISYLDNANAVMDEWVNWVAEKAGSATDPEEIVLRFNDTGGSDAG